MARFLIRRVSTGLLILLLATFIVYMLLAYSIDPLADLKTYNGPDRQIKIDSAIRALDLNTPPIQRYFKWIFGVVAFLWGKGTLGVSVINNQQITSALATAIPTTLTLVFAASIFAIIFGVAVGIITAIRQYSAFDYSTTFFSFFLYSLPSFWVAILLKQFGAIGFNDFLDNPVIPVPIIIILGLLIGILTYTVSASDLKRRLVQSGISFGITFVLLLLASLTHWFAKPGLTVIGVGLLTAGAAAAIIYVKFGKNKSAFANGAISVVVFTALYFPIQFAFQGANLSVILLLLAGYVVVGLIIGFLTGGDSKRYFMSMHGMIGFIAFLLTYADRLLQAWNPYMRNSLINGRPIATIGSATPNITGNYWILTMDSFTHLILPTLALLLMSFAGYTRYTRASMLDVLNADYIRTARAKGLPERTVIMRHAFKNAIIPLATIIPLDIAGVLGGAVITETIFGWKGMGNFFNTSLQHSDFNGVMGFLLVTASLAIAANIVSDILYAAIDPRIRLNG
jgi:peptide/nickel transport system permease protein